MHILSREPVLDLLLLVLLFTMVGCSDLKNEFIRAEEDTTKHSQDGDVDGPTGRWRPDEFFDDEQMIALANAAEEGDVKNIDQLVEEGVDVNTTGKDGMTILLWAFWAKNKKSFEKLLIHGANPNAQIKDYSSVMSFSAVYRDDPTWLEMSLRHGADPNVENLTNPHWLKKTPIFGAISKHNVRGVELLIAADADLDHKDSLGETPLMFAYGFKFFDIIYRLLEGGADYQIKDRFNHSVAGYIANSEDRFTNDEQKPWRNKVIQFLEKDGIDLQSLRKRLEHEND